MCLGVFCLGFILFGALWVSWTWVTISFTILGKFSAIISSSIFSWPFFLSFSSGTPMIWMLGRLALSQRSLRTLHLISKVSPWKHSVAVQSLSHVQLFAAPWDFPGKNSGMGWHFLLQGVFPTQELNQHLHSSCIAGRFFTTKPPGRQH